jgi:hypothetical protein
MVLRPVLLGAAVLFLASCGQADDAPPLVIVRGTIGGVDADSVSIVQANGTLAVAAVGPRSSFSTVERRTFDQIKASDFVGVTSVPGPNDTLLAKEIHVIPLKGLGEGSYAWDHRPGGIASLAPGRITNGTVVGVEDEAPAAYTMTNANVTAAYTMTNANVTASSAMELKVTYQGSTLVDGKCTGHAPRKGSKACTGVATVEVSPATPIVAIVVGKPSDARPGLTVFAATTPGPQGKPLLLSLVVEKNGVKPLF